MTVEERSKLINTHFRDHKPESAIANWSAEEVAAWIDGIKGVKIVEVQEINSQPAPAEQLSMVGLCFRDADICGAELLSLTREDIGDILSVEGSGIEPKLVVSRIKRILTSIERVRGETNRLSDNRASELISQVLALRGKLATLYGYRDQPV